MQKFFKQFSVYITPLFLLCTLINSAYASVNFPLPPRFSANALASDYTVGEADVMLPVKGDNAHNLYLDPTLAYGSDNQGYADLGLGYRWIHNEAAILGGYLFGGYSRIDNNARLWVANPGIEALGSRWDAHLNGYWVMGNRNQSAGNFLSPIFFRGHTGFVTPYREIQNAGSGADVQAGYQLFPGSSLKGYVGSYFFAPSQVSNIFGGAAGLEYWFDHYIKVVGAYTYDNVRHSTGALGIGVEFGGTRVHRSNPSLEERITDPVERYLSELGRGSAIPSRTHSEPQFMTIRNSAGQEITIPVPPIPILTDIAFFKQGGTPNNGGMGLTLTNCTFEHPCGQLDFSQTGVNTLNVFLPGTTMFFNGGSYPAVNAVGTGPIILNAGQSVHGRTEDYSLPAVEEERSIFNGAFILNTNNTLQSIILFPTTATQNGVGVFANNAADIFVNASQIGSTEDNSFLTGVRLTGNSSGTIANTTILSNGANTTGIDTEDSSTLTIFSNSKINSNGGDSNTTGLAANGTSLITISDSQVIASSTSGTIFAVATGGDNGRIIANNVQVGAISTNDGTAYTLQPFATGSNFRIIVTQGSRLVAQGKADSAIIAKNPDVVSIDSSTICLVNDTQGCP